MKPPPEYPPPERTPGGYAPGGYTPGRADPRLNRPVPERYPQIRATSGCADPRVRRTGPGAGTEQEPERSAMPTARLVVAITVVTGQLWALTVATGAWTAGRTGAARWCTGFSAASFLFVLLAWRIGPRDRRAVGRRGSAGYPR